MSTELVQRRLSAIFAADVVGYSRLMGLDEAGTLASLKGHRRELADAKIAEHQGRIVKVTGDGMLVEFPSVVNAVACAAEIQRKMRERNADVPEDRRIEFRIGIHLGDIISEGNDIFGDGVNIAARIEAIAPPGGVAISQSVRDHVGNRLGLTFDDMGDQALKNIDRPVRIYSIRFEGAPQRRAETRPSSKPSIAVLPFTNMSGDPEQEYFSDGITEDIITDLSKISGLSVIARNSVFTYKGKSADVQEVSRRFGVATVLEGSVRKAGQRIRINAQLISGRDGTHLWADRYDRDLTDIFAIQDEITKTIVDQLKVKLLPDERIAIKQAPTSNVEAYNFYLRGREAFRTLTKASLQLARRMFAKAVELDPTYARAYAGIAQCDAFLNTWYGQGSLDALLEISTRALELDPNLPEAHASHGLALGYTGRPEQAAAAFKRAIALDPNSHEAHYFFARHLFAQHDSEGALKHFVRAAEIEPNDYRSPILSTAAARSLGRFDEMRRLAMVGIERAERVLSLHPDNSDPMQLGATALAVIGEVDQSRKWLERALAIDPDDLNILYNAAACYAQLGDLEKSIDTLERLFPSLSGKGDDRTWFLGDSDFDSIREHPRYAKLLELFGRA